MKSNLRMLAVVGGAAAIMSAALATAQTTGSFSVISINVAGLPAALQGNDVPGDKTENHKTVGAKLIRYGYDLVNVQEDFNYHAALYSTATFPYRTATSGGVPFGSGLNTMSLSPFIDEVRVQWNDCSTFDGADCLTPKGFTMVRARLSSGSAESPQGEAFVDVYNLHADAGTTSADLAARASNLRQLSDHIKANSAGNAVVVFGDTNSRYSRTGDDIRIFGHENGMTDAWVQLVRGGVVPMAETLCSNPSTENYCETVDKILYRSGPLLDLRAAAWTYDSMLFLQANGDVLSDHNPVRANLTWALPAALRQSGLHGGPHAAWFSDADVLGTKTTASTPPRASVIRLRGGSRLDAVYLALSDGTVLSHGGDGGDASELTLADGERWTGARLCQDVRNSRTQIFYVEARTSSGRTLAAGVSSGECVDFAAPDGWGIVGYLGRADDEVRRLGFIFAPY